MLACLETPVNQSINQSINRVFWNPESAESLAIGSFKVTNDGGNTRSCKNMDFPGPHWCLYLLLGIKGIGHARLQHGFAKKASASKELIILVSKFTAFLLVEWYLIQNL